MFWRLLPRAAIRSAFALFLCLAAPVFARIITRPVAPTAQPTGTPAGLSVPKGLNVVDWNQIRSEYERHRHGAFPDSAGLKARSFEQQWLAKFDGRGFTVEPDGAAWRWGLEIQGSNGKAQVTSDVNRITYRWGKDFDEWFLNDTRGLEHGFTLRAPRPDIRLVVRGGLNPRINGGNVEFIDRDGIPRIQYSALQARDADGKPLPARMSIRDGQVVLSVDDRSARYPITIDPLAQQAYVKASNTRANANFGFPVSISGDTVVVGSFSESSNATGVNGNQSDASAPNTGAAYVFVRNGTTWTQQAYLKASTFTGGGDNFGGSVAIDGNTIVVGATRQPSSSTGVNGNETDTSAPQSGAAYIFVRSGTTWSQQAFLKASNTAQLGIFGASVGISANTVVVGAYGNADGGLSFSGSAYVFVRSGTTWSQQGYLKVSNPDANDQFGFSVVISADTVVVGAPTEDSNAVGINGNQTDNSRSNSGAAYVFVRNGTAWSQQAYLKASNSIANLNFAASLAIDGDTLVAGGQYDGSGATGVNGNQSDTSKPQSGAAYVFTRSGTSWSQQAYLKASNTTAFTIFGGAVAISDDTILVGSEKENSNATGIGGNQNDTSLSQSGAAYLFARSGTSWSQQAYVKASNTAANYGFGASVAISGDTFVVGSLGESSNSTGVNGVQTNTSMSHAGAAYIFAAPPTTIAVTIATSPAGLSFATTGTGCAPGTYTAPQTLQWTPASTCSLSVTTPQTASGTEYRFNQWENASVSATRSITAPSSPASYTATFDTYYQLTTDAGTGGSVSGSGLVLAGNNTIVTATPSAGFYFDKFTGAVTSTTNPLTLLMDVPKSVTANFLAQTSQTITFAALANRQFGSAPFTLTATGGGSGNPVVFTSTTTGTCTVSASTVTLVAIGTCTIQANQAGNTTFSAAPAVNQSFTVTPATQTIAFANTIPASVVFGSGPVSLSATSNAPSPSFTFGTTSASSICTVSGTTVTLVGGGACSLTATAAASGYYAAASTPVTRTLTINTASQTIAFSAPSDRPLGAAPFTLGATASSGLAPSYAPVPSLIDVQFGCTAGSQCAGSNGNASTLQQSGPAVLGNAGDVWNLVSGVGGLGTTGSNVPLTDTTGTPSPVTVSWTSDLLSTVGTSPGNFGSTQYRNLMSAYLVNRVGQPARSITISGLIPGANYDLYMITQGDANAGSRRTSFAVNGGTVVSTTAGADIGSYVNGQNYVRLSTTANSSGVLNVVWQVVSGEANVNGFQLAGNFACSVSGSTVTLSGIGPCTIQASQPGNASYAAATPVTRTFNVLQTVTILTTPLNLMVSVDGGTAQAAPVTVNLTAGSHTVSVGLAPKAETTG